jgi:hypothetical protein
VRVDSSARAEFPIFLFDMSKAGNSLILTHFTIV